MQKIMTIIDKEWAELFRNKWLMFTILFLPLVFTALPLIMLGSTQDVVANDLTGSMPPEILGQCSPELTTGECSQIFFVNQFLLLFMLLPLIIPINIAAFSIVGEKNNRSLEPLLATPITITELLVGKNLAAVIPAVLATWVGFIIYVIGAWILTPNPAVLASFRDPMWLLAVTVVGPLLAVLAVNFAILVSSRVNDVRAAEQLSAMVVMPVIMLFVGQVIGWFTLNKLIIIWVALGLVILDGIIVFFTVEWFERESILTRWS